MNNKWILADWHLFIAFAEKMLQVYPQLAGNLNISKRQKDNQYGKIYMVQFIFFSSLRLGTVGLLCGFLISFILFSFHPREENYWLASPSEGISQTHRCQFTPHPCQCPWWSLFLALHQTNVAVSRASTTCKKIRCLSFTPQEISLGGPHHMKSPLFSDSAPQNSGQCVFSYLFLCSLGDLHMCVCGKSP